jgi:hypothetical protein
MIVAPEDPPEFDHFVPKIKKESRFSSRGGFSAVKSKFINDGYLRNLDDYNEAFLAADEPVREPNTTRSR